MADAGIETAAELEKRWLARFGGLEATVHRQVMRLTTEAKRPKPETVAKLAALTGKPADYFTGDSPDRLEGLEALAVANEASLRELRLAVESHDSLLEVEGLAVQELRAAVEERLDQLELRVRALEQ